MKKWRCGFNVEGLNIERFIRCADEQGVRLTDVRRCGDRMLSAVACEGLFPTLADIAAKGGWVLTKGKRRGIGTAVTIARQRWMLLAFVLIGCAALVLVGQCMWHITIIDGGVYTADIRIAMNELGIHPPMFRWQVEPGEIKEALEWRYPCVAWVECGWRGTTLEIRIVEGHVVNDAASADTCYNIVASRNGIVESIVTASGTPVVSPGEVVLKGQILIKGEERISGGETRPVAAKGCVMARVWDTAQVKTSLSGWQTEYTGRSQAIQAVTSPWFPLWNPAESPYEQQDVSITTARAMAR